MPLSNIPQKADDSREDALLAQVHQGNYELHLSTITSEHNGRRAEFFVFSDALKIDGVRINVRASTQQLIADALDCSLLTAKLADLMWAQRTVTLPPFPRGNTKGMDSLQAMIDHSKKIDNALEKLGNPTGLIGTVGKHWILDNAIAGKLLYGVEAACNYGWHFEGQSFERQAFEVTASQMKDASGKFCRLIQGRGTRHDRNHTDYSQVCVLVSNDCLVDGVSTRLPDLLVDPNLAPLASHQGVLKVLRQPGA